VLNPSIEAGLLCWALHSLPIITRLSPKLISEWAKVALIVLDQHHQFEAEGRFQEFQRGLGVAVAQGRGQGGADHGQAPFRISAIFNAYRNYLRKRTAQIRRHSARG
jgi:hypothetical protein